MLTALVVVARIVANPISNVFRKRLAQRAANPVFVISATHALLTLAALAFSATEAVFLKRAVLHASLVITFLFWSVPGLPVAGAALIVVLGRRA